MAKAPSAFGPMKEPQKKAAPAKPKRSMGPSARMMPPSAPPSLLGGTPPPPPMGAPAAAPPPPMGKPMMGPGVPPIGPPAKTPPGLPMGGISGMGGAGKVGRGGAVPYPKATGSLKDRVAKDAKYDRAHGVKEDSPADKQMDRKMGLSEKDEERLGKGGSGENWIAGATKNKGALHRKLGVPEGDKIPARKLAEAKHSSDPTERKEANLASTLGKLGKGGLGAVRRLGNAMGGGRHPAEGR